MLVPRLLLESRESLPRLTAGSPTVGSMLAQSKGRTLAQRRRPMQTFNSRVPKLNS